MATLEITGLNELEKAWELAPEIIEQEMTKALYEALAYVEAEVKKRTPRAFGHLADSIYAEPIEVSPQELVGVVGTSLNYAAAVELGTKPHFPPIQPLADWAQVKLGLSAKDAQSAAFGIARKIAGKMKGVEGGTEPVHMFKDTYESPEVQATVDAIFQRYYLSALQRIASQ